MAERRTRLDGLAVALMLFCCVLWGVQQVIVKTTLPVFPPFLQGALRSVIAAALVWAWSVGRGIPLFARDRTFVPGITAGLLFGLEFLCIFASLALTDASRVSVFIYLAPFVVALCLPHFEPSERLSPLQMAGLVAAFLALAYAFQEGFTSVRPQQWIGDALAIAAAALWGATTMVIRTTRLKSAMAEKTLFYQLAVSGIVLSIAAVVTREHWPTVAVPWWAWASIGFQSVIIAFVSYLVWFWLLRQYPATRLSAFSFLTPVFGLVCASLALGESISLRLIVAMGFIAVGIVLVNGKSARQPALVREVP